MADAKTQSGGAFGNFLGDLLGRSLKVGEAWVTSKFQYGGGDSNLAVQRAEMEKRAMEDRLNNERARADLETNSLKTLVKYGAIGAVVIIVVVLLLSLIRR